MFALRIVTTIANIFWILMFLVFSNVKDRNAAIASLSIELVFICDTILIWS